MAITALGFDTLRNLAVCLSVASGLVQREAASERHGPTRALAPQRELRRGGPPSGPRTDVWIGRCRGTLHRGSSARHRYVRGRARTPPGLRRGRPSGTRGRLRAGPGRARGAGLRPRRGRMCLRAAMALPATGCRTSSRTTTVRRWAIGRRPSTCCRWPTPSRTRVCRPRSSPTSRCARSTPAIWRPCDLDEESLEATATGTPARHRARAGIHEPRLSDPTGERTDMSQPTRPEGAIRAVIADDEAFIRQVLLKMLERLGIEVVGVAENGRMALELYDQSPPGHRDPRHRHARDGRSGDPAQAARARSPMPACSCARASAASSTSSRP